MEEVWKDISGYEGIYKISNTGRVLSFYVKGREVQGQTVAEYVKV